MLVIAVLLIPNMINYVGVILFNLGNWCGTPEASASILLWTHWVVLLGIHQYHGKKLLARSAADTAQAFSPGRFRLETIGAKVTKLILAAAVVVFVELVALRMIML